MARLSILDRFRPVGAPGPAGPAGVPATDDQGPAAELAPVFAALAEGVNSARVLVEQATREAEETLAGAREQARAIVAAARLEAGAERARAAERVEQAAADEDTLRLERAGADAETLGRAGAALLPGTVKKVIDALLAEQLAAP